MSFFPSSKSNFYIGQWVYTSVVHVYLKTIGSFTNLWPMPISTCENHFDTQMAFYKTVEGHLMYWTQPPPPFRLTCVWNWKVPPFSVILTNGVNRHLQVSFRNWFDIRSCFMPFCSKMTPGAFEIKLTWLGCALCKLYKGKLRLIPNISWVDVII